MEAIAGRSIPGMVFSTKREIAINAPVLPALTQASRLAALYEIDGDAHRGIFLALERIRRWLVHGDHLRSVMNAKPRTRLLARLLEFCLDRIPQSDEDNDRCIRMLEKAQSCGHGNVRAEISPHTVHGKSHVHRRRCSSTSANLPPQCFGKARFASGQWTERHAIGLCRPIASPRRAVSLPCS